MASGATSSIGPVARPPTSIVNAYSAGAVSALGVGFHRGKEVLSGANTAAALATVLSVAGSGVIALLCAYCKDATSRTVRLRVTIDGVVVFDATTGSISVTNEGLCAIGHSGRDNSGSATYNWQLEAVPFNASLLVQVATSVASETDKIGVGYSYYKT